MKKENVSINLKIDVDFAGWGLWVKDVLSLGFSVDEFLSLMILNCVENIPSLQLFENMINVPEWSKERLFDGLLRLYGRAPGQCLPCGVSASIVSPGAPLLPVVPGLSSPGESIDLVN